MNAVTCPHWSRAEWLHETVRNPNIVVRGRHSYFSGHYDGPFERTVVRYLYGDPFSTDPETGWTPLWPIDKLMIGDYVQIAPGVKILMGGNHTHNARFISTYPFLEPEALLRAYEGAGDTVIGNDVWLGMCAMIMPGVTIGDGAIVGANAVVTRDVPDYAFVAGNPAKLVRKRFDDTSIEVLKRLAWWTWPDAKVKALLASIQSPNDRGLESASAAYDESVTSA